ncbi:MAG TPA: EutN/CcmL family microcompartment protein [Pirellulales bacterium]|nr:EutN/CcmL family microcompartment protein [Pirellulales bacterium]
MRIGEVIGSVTLSRRHPSLTGASFRLAVPLTLVELSSGSAGAGEPIVVYDDLGAGDGSLIAISEGGEAAQPFRPHDKPVDAYNAAILDSVDIANGNKKKRG